MAFDFSAVFPTSDELNSSFENNFPPSSTLVAKKCPVTRVSDLPRSREKIRTKLLIEFDYSSPFLPTCHLRVLSELDNVVQGFLAALSQLQGVVIQMQNHSRKLCSLVSSEIDRGVALLTLYVIFMVRCLLCSLVARASESLLLNPPLAAAL